MSQSKKPNSELKKAALSAFELSEFIIDQLIRQGVRNFCICAGGRNAPLVQSLYLKSDVQVFSFFDERSAAFFALGLIQESRAPAAVLTTSGTAVAELFPACIEACYQALPLILVTADRPSRFRGTGAPQAMEQKEIFGNYVNSYIEIEWEKSSFDVSLKGPTQLNVCLDEPLVRRDVLEKKPVDFSDTKARSEFGETSSIFEIQPQKSGQLLQNDRPVFIVGALSLEESQFLTPFISQWSCPVFAEPSSQLWGVPGLTDLLVKSGEKILVESLETGEINQIIRLGGIPTGRFWRDLETRYREIPLAQFSRGEFSGSPGLLKPEPLACFADFTEKYRVSPTWNSLFERDEQRDLRQEELLLRHPQSEPGLVRALSNSLKREDSLFLGNSLPIREWTDFASREKKLKRILVNRGMNGIDGLVSTFLGSLNSRGRHFLLLGDLSALYDMNAFWVAPQLGSQKWTVFVINNQGGKIFERIFHDPRLENQHDLGFEKLAEFWRLKYERVEKPEDFQFLNDLEGPTLCEMRPMDSETKKFWDLMSQSGQLSSMQTKVD